MSKSLMSDTRECYMCKYTNNLHRHHVFFGTGRRALSEEDGCWCYLCGRHHNMEKTGVHFNRTLDLHLKAVCQKKWEEVHGSRDEFIARYGRNYLE